MSFRREYNKINRGLRCRCSTGESWALAVCFIVAPGEGGGKGVCVGGGDRELLRFLGVGRFIYRDLTGGCARRRRREEEMPLRAYG